MPGRRAPLSSLLARRLIVVTGKGGVGKTTVAAALGLAAARAGKRAIVAEVARRGDVAGAFEHDGMETFEEVELAPGLWHISIDPQDAMEEYLRDQLPVGGVAEILAQSRMFGLFAAATPGMRELLTIGKVWELAQADRRTPGAPAYDLVICDAPATGHGVAVLAAPRTFAGVAQVGPVARQGHTIHAMLSDPERTGVVAVTRAEEMPVVETAALQAALKDELGLPLTLVVANALEQDRFSGREATRLVAHDGHPAVRAALATHRRAAEQSRQLTRLQGLTGLEPVRLALHPAGPDLDALACDLGAAL